MKARMAGSRVPSGAPDEQRLIRGAWLPLPLFVLALAVCLVSNPQGVFQPWWLQAVLGAIFSGGISILVAYLAARSYLAGGTGAVLLLGCGILTFGMSNTVGSMLTDLPDPNRGISLFNIAVMIAGSCHVASALWAIRAPAGTQRRPQAIEPVLAYGAVLLLIWAIVESVEAGLLPLFFVQGVGATPTRSAVLGAAICLFAAAAVLYGALARRTGRVFCRWYGLGLGLIATGLVGVFFQKAVGTPLNWVGRAAQYLGGVYIFIAVWTGLREAGMGQAKSLALMLSAALVPSRHLEPTAPARPRGVHLRACLLSLMAGTLVPLLVLAGWMLWRVATTSRAR